MKRWTLKLLKACVALTVTGSVLAQETSNPTGPNTENPFGPYDSYSYTDALADSTYLDVKANAGTYGPVTLGQSVSLNGCASNVQNQSLSRVLCNAGVDLTNFVVRWQASKEGSNSWTTISEVNGNASGSAAVVSALTTSALTGAGSSVFTTAGNYTIGLYIFMKSASTTLGLTPTITFDSGGQSFTKSPAGDWKLRDADGEWGGFSNASFQHTSLSIAAVPVSEPAAVFLMLTGLAFIGRSERRRRRKLQSPV